jgi:hypothetical protein
LLIFITDLYGTFVLDSFSQFLSVVFVLETEMGKSEDGIHKITFLLNAVQVIFPGPFKILAYY